MTNNSDIMKKMGFFICFIALFTVVLPNIAFAADPSGYSASSTGLTGVLCNVVQQLQGGLGKAIATIAIIVLGIGLFLGKLSWPLALITAIGIGMIFGAANIVDWIGGSSDASTTCSSLS